MKNTQSGTKNKFATEHSDENYTMKRHGTRAKKGHQPKLKAKVISSPKADQLFSVWIRQRDKRCFFCSNPATQASHFWGRANSATRYDPENVDGACGGCQLRHEDNKQGLYRTLKLQQLGQAGYAALERRARSVVKRRDATEAFLRWHSPAEP